MPKYNTVLQTEKYPFQPYIWPNLPENCHFSTFFSLQNPQKLLGIPQLSKIIHKVVFCIDTITPLSWTYTDSGPVGSVLTGPLLAQSYTICIRVSYSTGPFQI